MLKDGRDAHWVERARDGCLATEPARGLNVEGPAEYLQGDVSLEALVAGEVDDTHSAGTELLSDDVATGDPRLWLDCT